MFHLNHLLLLSSAIGLALGFKCPDSDSVFPFKVPHERDPQKYYKCQDNAAILLSCPLDHYFDEALEACVQDKSNDYPINIVCPTDPQMPLYFPHPFDCTKFFQCDNGKGVEMDCAPGTWFNADLSRCTFPADSGCVASTTASPTTTEEATTEDGGETTTEDGGETTTDDGGVTEDDLLAELEDDDSPINVICPMSDDGLAVFVPHPYDCALYFMCQFQQSILMRCPDGLLFDTTLEVCNWPDQVVCDVKPWPTTTEEPEVTTNDSGEETTEGGDYTTVL